MGLFDVLKAGSLGALKVRMDGWTNNLIGLGGSRDKSHANRFLADALLTDQELEQLFHHDDLANRIVSAVPEEALRQGCTLTRSTEEGEGEKDSKVKDIQERAVDIQRELDALNAFTRLKEALIWGRLYGGAALLLGVKGSRNYTTPLPEGASGLDFLTVLDKRDLTPASWYRDVRSPKFGQVETYWLQPQGMNVPLENRVTIHESRLIMFGGALTSKRERERNQGWDHSVLQRCYNALRDCNSNWSSVVHMFTDFSQAVWKINGLMQMIAEGDSQTMQTRMAIADTVRSVARAIVLDAEGEDFQVVERGAMTGVDSLIDKTFLRLSAAARMPVSILMGQAPAGLNATGASDLRWWYDTIRTSQEQEIAPKIQRLVLLLTGEDGWKVKWPSLWQMTPAEEAELRSKIATTDQVYVNMGAVLPEEITLSRWGTGAYSTDMQVDIEARTALLDAAKNPPDDFAELEWEKPEEGEEQEDKPLGEGTAPKAPPAQPQPGVPMLGAGPKQTGPAKPGGGSALPVQANAKDPGQALNGAQVSGLLEILASVAEKRLPRATGVEAMLASFPLTRAQAEAIMGDVGAKFFAEPEPPPAPFGGGGGKPFGGKPGDKPEADSEKGENPFGKKDKP